MQYRLNLSVQVAVLVSVLFPEFSLVMSESVTMLVSLFSTVLMIGVVTVSATSKMTALLFESVFLSV